MKYVQVAKLRDVLGLSQQKLGDISGLSQSLVANLESGRRVDVDVALLAISAATGVTEESLRIEGPLLNVHREPYKLADFEIWQGTERQHHLERCFEAANSYLKTWKQVAFFDATKTFTGGKAQAFLSRLQRFLQAETKALGAERIETIFAQQAETNRITLGATALAQLFPDRILPSEGDLEVEITFTDLLPVSLAGNSQKIDITITDKSGRVLNIAPIEPTNSEIIALLKKVKGDHSDFNDQNLALSKEIQVLKSRLDDLKSEKDSSR